ncbi:cyanobactin maturation protease PatG family protein [Streptomyces noursei]|uniref:cyanobactin maturation protease PatG family protein n=1 Tax=Streptomyces noursei TaxID=1971 RepID=UPI001F18B139|nr:hypothetical protein [Streptomyces noursei]MCE4941904.1 hypothetical protein [Streptomyces noursei]
MESNDAGTVQPRDEGTPEGVAEALPSPGRQQDTNSPRFPRSTARQCDCAGRGATESPGANSIANPYVYALGRIEPRFPSLGAEKEFAQAIGRAETANLTDRQAVHAVLSSPENRYLVKQLCYVLTVQDTETYILQPRDPFDFNLLVEAIRPLPRPTDLDVVIGLRGPLAPPDLCNGLVVPVAIFDQIYSFDADSLVRAIPRPDGTSEEIFTAAAEELLTRIKQVADNAGTLDEHRVLNYLAVRYPAIYTKSVEAFSQGASLSAVEVRPSRLSGVRKILDVVFSYSDRQTDFTEKFFVRVDAAEMFPFIVTKLSPYYDR